MQFKHWAIFTAIIFSALACTPSTDDAQTGQNTAEPAWHSVEVGDSLEVLFVGNSYTFYHDMPEVLEEMGTASGVTMTVEMSTFPGVDWGFHTGPAISTLDEIATGNYDVVVLQNHSLSTRDQYEEFLQEGTVLIDAVQAAGAIPVLYQTWARQDYSIAQTTITNVYSELADQHQILTVPVGPIWQSIRDRDGTLGDALFDPDGSHPSKTGSYLVATVFYRFLTGNPSQALPALLETIEVDANQADALQEAVDSYEVTNLPKELGQ